MTCSADSCWKRPTGTGSTPPASSATGPARRRRSPLSACTRTANARSFTRWAPTRRCDWTRSISRSSRNPDSAWSPGRWSCRPWTANRPPSCYARPGKAVPGRCWIPSTSMPPRTGGKSSSRRCRTWTTSFPPSPRPPPYPAWTIRPKWHAGSRTRAVATWSSSSARPAPSGGMPTATRGALRPSRSIRSSIRPEPATAGARAFWSVCNAARAFQAARGNITIP